MRVTILGSAASHAARGQACAGHLVEGGGVRVLFDCGNGVLSNLYAVADPYTLDAVFVTHNHPDHYVDLYSMQAMLRYAPQGPLGAVPLYAPAPLFERMQLLLSERGAREFRDAFDFRPLEAGSSSQLGDMRVTARAVDHTEPTFALVAESDGAKLAYTADSAAGPWVSEALAGADLALAEATLPEQYEGAAPHLTASQAGALARAAGARQLVLVHVWPTNDREEMAHLASQSFGGVVRVATEFDVYEVTTEGKSA